MDWNEERDGPMVKSNFQADWIDRLFWTMLPNHLGFFSFERLPDDNTGLWSDIELGSPQPQGSAENLQEADPVVNEPDVPAGGNLIGGGAEDEDEDYEKVYVCLFGQNRGERRLKHTELRRAVVQAPLVPDTRISDKELFTRLRKTILRSRASLPWPLLTWFVPVEVSGISFWEVRIHFPGTCGLRSLLILCSSSYIMLRRW